MNDSVSIHNRALLADSFRAVRRPLWRSFMRGPNGDVSLTLPVKGIPIKVALPKNLWRSVTLGMRYAAAAWKWLQPDDPCRTLRDLPRIQESAGLDHIDRQTFANALIDSCKDTMRLQPQLRRWGEYRIAALEYWADPPRPVDQRLADLAVTLRNGLWRAHHIAWPDPARGLSRVDKVGEDAMHAAALSVTQTLGIEGTSSLSANLMVPFSDTVEFPTNDNWNRAVELWTGMDTSKRLVIVAETEGSSHAAFWVPATRGEGGAVLPGAPTAYVHLEGDVVLKDDLPPLRGFGERIEARWRSYMFESFQQKLFVSVPFRAPNGHGGYIAPAILNVNADAHDVTRWKRAYHPEWLALVRERVQPFVEIALTAWLIRLNQEVPDARLDTGSEAWDTLPTVGPQLALGDAHEPDEEDDGA
jgi:hypothetical protein